MSELPDFPGIMERSTQRIAEISKEIDVLTEIQQGSKYSGLEQHLAEALVHELVLKRTAMQAHYMEAKVHNDVVNKC